MAGVLAGRSHHPCRGCRGHVLFWLSPRRLGHGVVSGLVALAKRPKLGLSILVNDPTHLSVPRGNGSVQPNGVRPQHVQAGSGLTRVAVEDVSLREARCKEPTAIRVES